MNNEEDIQQTEKRECTCSIGHYIDPGCDYCIDGRKIECVAEYASTCDGCANLTLHEQMAMNPLTQLGYCHNCRDEHLPNWQELEDEPLPGIDVFFTQLRQQNQNRQED